MAPASGIRSSGRSTSSRPCATPSQRAGGACLPVRRPARHGQNHHRAPAGQGGQLPGAQTWPDRPCDECEHCQAVNEGRFLDLIEIDAASNTSVDDVRDLRDKINFSPSQGSYKVYIIDEVHMLSTAAFNALLKTLEEPPAARHLHPGDHRSPQDPGHGALALPAARVPPHPGGARSSACSKEMANSEKLEVEDDALTLIARQATGAMRDAISLLDQLASTGRRDHPGAGAQLCWARPPARR